MVLLYGIIYWGCSEDSPTYSVEIYPIDDSIAQLEDSGLMRFGITYTNMGPRELTLVYNTRNITAIAGDDFQEKSANLTLMPNSKDDSLFVEIEVEQDQKFEADEQFELIFFSTEDFYTDTLRLMGIIVNDDELEDSVYTSPYPGYTTPLKYEGMKLIWQDEFEGDLLNTNFWTQQIGTGCPNLCGWGNNELEYYREENTSLEGGLLTITAKKEEYANRHYTSSRIKSSGKVSVALGRIDIRAKLPYSQGLWPALWMLGQNRDTVGWPAAGEIDIVELNGITPHKICGTLHYQNGNGGHQNSGAKCYYLFGEKYADEFHVFSLIWDSIGIIWLMDDIQFNEEKFADLKIGQKPNPFLKPFYFTLNVAVGGNYVNPPDETTVWPQKMEVDYIRVFQE